MATLAILAERQELVPSEMKRFGNRVHYFKAEQREGEDWPEAKLRTYREIRDFMLKSEGELYTGHHSESDWTKVSFWQRGFHIVNTTGDFAVVTP